MVKYEHEPTRHSCAALKVFVELLKYGYCLYELSDRALSLKESGMKSISVLDGHRHHNAPTSAISFFA